MKLIAFSLILIGVFVQKLASNSSSVTQYLPLVSRSMVCSTGTLENYGLVPVDGEYYKSNRLTDENADFRLSLLGYLPSTTSLGIVDYGPPTHDDRPQFVTLFQPSRVPLFLRTYKRYNWIWNESSEPPYGVRGEVNNEWEASVIDAQTDKGENIYVPERNGEIGNGFVAMVLYADESELTLAYFRQDSVEIGYVVHISNLCVDRNLVELYRAQLVNGYRYTGKLPGITNGQPVGIAQSDYITFAIRDKGRYLDPRSKQDWWQ